MSLNSTVTRGWTPARSGLDKTLAYAFLLFIDFKASRIEGLASHEPS